jgi:hypothetical protein
MTVVRRCSENLRAQSTQKCPITSVVGVIGLVGVTAVEASWGIHEASAFRLGVSST